MFVSSLSLLGYGVLRASETQVARMVTRMKYSKGCGRVQSSNIVRQKGRGSK